MLNWRITKIKDCVPDYLQCYCARALGCCFNYE